jgi:uncharacterized protein YacL
MKYMNWNLTLRISLSLGFALIAFIFSEVVPDISPLNHIWTRIFITLFFGFIGFGIFPDIAKRISLLVISYANFLTARVSSEVMNQIVRMPQVRQLHAPLSHNAAVGGVSMNQPLILDTSAIIDGRLLDIARTGFLLGTLLIPSFVLSELQQVADSADYLKRSRGRRGFEILEELKKVKGLRVEVWDRDIAAKGVDDKLLKLAKNFGGRIVTTDYNLNRVASVTGVNVLNINDLANAVKTVVIPGEEMKVKIIHLGKDLKQGVGYLPDGTMIVVEGGADLVGQDVKAEVTRVLQVSAGKMIFTKLA